MVSNPVTTTPDATVAEVDHLCATYRVSGLPVVDGEGVLVGIITNRDMRSRTALCSRLPATHLVKPGRLCSPHSL